MVKALKPGQRTVPCPAIEIIPVAFHGVINQGLIVGTVWNLNTLQRVGDYVSEAKWD